MFGVNETPPRTWPDPAAVTVRNDSPAEGTVAETRSVIVTSLFGSAPWSPAPLTVDVMAQIVTLPSRYTRPVMLRRPSVAGAHGSPVAALLPVGYRGTVDEVEVEVEVGPGQQPVGQPASTIPGPADYEIPPAELLCV